MKYTIKTKFEDGTWIAFVEFSCSDGKGCSWVTSGKTKEELWEMIADLVLTTEDVKISWWNKLVSKLYIY